MDLSIDSADVLRLIQSHLTECGLHQSFRVLQQESGVLGAGSSHSNWKAWASEGDWGSVLRSLSSIDPKRISRSLMANVYEMAILELGEMGEIELAYATLRAAQAHLDCASSARDANKTKRKLNEADEIPRSRIIEQRLASLMASRNARSEGKGGLLPPDYYGLSTSAAAGTTKEELREEIGKHLSESVPQIPPSRLVSLLQQAVKWQSFTGQLPSIRHVWAENEADENGRDGKNNPADGAASNRKRKKQKRQFDLVLGETDGSVAQDVAGGATKKRTDVGWEPIASKPYSTISFGKKATAECAVFLQDASGLITGSSDGLVEVWDPKERYRGLRTDLSYQKQEEFLGHDETAVMSVTLSKDGAMLATGDREGTIKVWRFDTGKCLRQITAHSGSVVAALQFSPDGSHVLTASHDFTCREFGLRTSRMLKEFRGHSSFVNTCHYSVPMTDNDDDDSGGMVVRVITGSADGTARIWDGRTTEMLQILRPISMGPVDLLDDRGLSVVRTDDGSSDSGSPSLHTIIPLHTPPRSMILVPRGVRAFLVSSTGIVLQTYQREASTNTTSVFVAATVSPSNRWLYVAADDGTCYVYDVSSGNVEKTIRNFADETTSNRGAKSSMPEITCLIHHPHKGMVGAFSSDKGQKRGSLTLWK